MVKSNEHCHPAGGGGSAIQEFYRGVNVFITGATGFMGKVLIEKLLRSCPDIGDIYLLVRSKRGKLVSERIDELISSPCFDRLREEKPEFKSKLIAVAGDIGMEGLGIGEQDRQLLAEQVNIVFHVAATVRFDEQLNLAIKLNVRGTRDLLVLCRTFSKLKSVVHVSTAYANCPSYHITEDFFDMPMNCDVAILMAEKLGEQFVDTLTPTLLGVWPNSYAFTKGIGEGAVKQYGQDLPVGIFRPSIVLCTRDEPEPGWIDNLYGPNGMVVACVSGFLRTTVCDRKMEGNVVPCDMVISGLIASAYDVHNRHLQSAGCPVYNFVNPHCNAITWNYFLNEGKRVWAHFPVKKAMWPPTMVIVKNKHVALIYRVILHFIPALLVDGLLLLTGRKPQMLQAYRKIHKLTGVLEYFSVRQWVFDDSNLTCVWAKMSDKDRALFPFNMRLLDWNKYMQETCVGLRKHLLNEGPETLPDARKKARRLRWLQHIVMAIIYCFLAWCAIKVLAVFF